MSAVVFNGLEKRFFQPASISPVTALSGLSLTVERGEIFGFVGLNGAGKTTAVKILLGLSRADSGIASVLDGSQAFSVPEKIGFAPEIPYLPPFLTVNELLEYSCALTGVHATDALLDRAVTMLSLTEERHRRIDLLSKGTRQRVSLAAAVVHKPLLVILDEPSSGLDPLGRKLIKEVIRQLNAEGATVFFSTHILSDLPGLCTRIGLINRGRQIFVGTPAEFCGSADGAGIEESFERAIHGDQSSVVVI